MLIIERVFFLFIDGGLIISEATFIHQEARGYEFVPGERDATFQEQRSHCPCQVASTPRLRSHVLITTLSFLSRRNLHP